MTLREAIDAYKDLFGQRELMPLARLAKSPAAKSFQRLKLKNSGDEVLILNAYLRAEDVLHNFPQHVAKAKRTLAEMERLGKSLREMRMFVDRLAKQSESVNSLFSPIIRDDVAAMTRGLDLIDRRIEAKRCNAKETIPQFGVTRKTQSKKAAANSAIWLLAKEVHLVTGEPKLEAVADLAGVIIGATVTLDRVRHVVRNRRLRYDKAVDAQTTRLTGTFNEMMAELNRRKPNESQVKARSRPK
jgi:hypothetical protein